MNRRHFTRLGIVASIALLNRPAHSAASRQPERGFLDRLTVDASLVRDAHVRAFQLPASSSLYEQIMSLYWVVALGFVVSDPDDVADVRDAAWSSVPDWYVATDNAMTLGQPFEAGLGGQSIADGAAARYWDVANPGDPDDVWRQFAIGCVAAWSDDRLLMLWGCGAEVNPVAPLLDLASSAHAHWETTASSLVPDLAALPIGMVLIDDGSLDFGITPQRPDRFGGL